MSAEEHAEILRQMTPPQRAVLRITIMAERRLRTHYQRDPQDQTSLQGAYAWAREQVSA